MKTLTKQVKPLILTFNTAREQAEYWFDREFSYVNIDDISDNSELNECIVQPSDEVLKPEYMSDNGIEEDDINENDFEEWKYTREWYPMWSTLFKCDSFFEDKVDELYKIGVGVISHNDNTYLFICGAGYDFYEAHWIPLFTEVLHRIEFEEPVHA